MATLLEVQRELLARRYNIGPSGADGHLGPATLGAILEALKLVPVLPEPEKPPVAPSPPETGLVPMEWMPWARMQRIIVHWTAGHHTPSENDRSHYHILIDGDGRVIRGKPSIKLNEAPAKPGYAAHTRNCNSGSIGVTLCCMAGAEESPFSSGPSPMTRRQWDVLPIVLADLCERYGIPVGPATLLSHAEVQGTLGIPQRGKWDITRLSFDLSVKGAKTVGDKFRAATKALL